MRKIFLAIAALLLCITPASAQAVLKNQQYQYQWRSPAIFTKQVGMVLGKFNRGGIGANPSFEGAQYMPEGAIYQLQVPVVSSSGGAVLTQFVLPAGSLVTSGDTLRLRVYATTAANANAKQVQVIWGSQTIVLLNTTSNNLDVYADISIVRTGLNTQRVNVAGYANGALLTGLSVNGTQAETATINVGINLPTAVASSDVSLNGLTIVGEP